MTASNPTLLRRLRPLYLAAFFQGFVLWYAIEKLFMTKIGIGASGIAIIIVVFTLVMMLVNLPMGILADRWSRKGILVVATLILAASTIVDGTSHGFWAYLLGSCLWGIFFACYSGVYDSIVYDTLIEETGSSTKFEFYYGKVQLYDGAALVVSSLCSSFVVHIFGLRGAYFASLPMVLFALAALWKFKEPQLHKAAAPSLLGAHIRETIGAVLHRREILWLSLSLISLTVAARLVLEFDQLWLIALALPLVLYGPVNALLLTAYGVSGLFADRIRERSLVIIGLSLCTVVGSIFMLYHVISLTIFVIFVILLGMTTLEVIITRLLHDTLPSNIRAGATSTLITAGYAVFLPIGLLFGEVVKRWGIFRASWIVISVMLLIALSIMMVFRTVPQPSVHPEIEN